MFISCACGYVCVDSVIFKSVFTINIITKKIVELFSSWYGSETLQYCKQCESKFFSFYLTHVRHLI